MPIKKTINENSGNKKQPIKKIETKPKKVTNKQKETEIPDSKILKKITSPKDQTKPQKIVRKKTISDEIDLNETSDKEGAQVPLIERMGFAKTKKFKEDKYIRIASDAPKEKFQEMGKKVMDGLIEWSFFAIDGDKGYHYYLVLENNKK